jgi:hypothetical protein
MKRLIFCMITIGMAVSATAQQMYAEDSPRAMLAGKSGNMITLDEISNAGKIQCNAANVKILNFGLTLVNDGVIVSRVSHNDKISTAMIDQLKQLQKGQKFIIDEINALKPNGQTIRLRSLKFTMD